MSKDVGALVKQRGFEIHASSHVFLGSLKTPVGLNSACFPKIVLIFISFTEVLFLSEGKFYICDLFGQWSAFLELFKS